MACRLGDIARMQRNLDKGADINMAVESPAIHGKVCEFMSIVCFILKFSTPLQYALENFQEEAALFLLQQDSLDLSKEESPMVSAMTNNCFRVVQELLKRVPEQLNDTDEVLCRLHGCMMFITQEGYTMLHLALTHGLLGADMIKILVQLNPRMRLQCNVITM